MAENSGFFEAQWDETIDNGDGTYGNWDRRYLSENFAQYFKNFVGNGVFASPTDQLKVSPAPSGLAVVVSAGWAFINGYWYHNDAAKTIEVPANSGSTSRIDSIKVRLNLSNRITTVDIYTGTTAVVRNDTYYDLKLAEIVVPAYATSIDAANVTDTRPNEAVCGFVKGLVEVVSTADLFAQYTAIFNEWFDGVKDQVTGDLAIRLQLEFTELNGNVEAYQRSVEADVDAAEALIQGYVYNDYITNELSFTFVNNRCEIADTRVTSNSLLDVYFTSDTIDEAENCEINIESGNQKYILTCVKTPSITIRGRIRVRVNSAIPVLPPEFDEYAPKDWVSSNFLSEESIRELSDDIETNTSRFETINGGLLQSCVVELEPKQSGSGDPSPQNVRPITGHTSVEVDVTNADSNTTQYTVALGQTVYGGSLDVVSGVLTIDKSVFTITKNTAIKLDLGSQFYVSNVIPNFVKRMSYSTEDIICDKLPTVANNTNVSNNVLGVTGYRDVYHFPNQNWIYFGTGDSSITTVEQLKIWLESNPLTVCYKLSIPQTIQLTPQQINTLIGENHLDIPLEGQSLDSAVYRELFAWDDVTDVVKPIADDIDDANEKGYIGFNLFERLEQGAISGTDGSLMSATTRCRSNDFVEIKSASYNITQLATVKTLIIQYDASKQFIVTDYSMWDNNITTYNFTPNSSAKYIKIATGFKTDAVCAPSDFVSNTWLSVKSNTQLDATKADISSIGTDESNNDKASKAYSQGDYFYKNGIAKAKTSIAQGATFTLNTNYEIKTLAEILKALES